MISGPPFAWFGGKTGLADRIVRWVPDRGVYLELFGGSAAVLWRLPPSPRRMEIYNDLDEGLVGFFRVLRDPVLAERLQARLRLTPRSRAEWRWARDTWREVTDPVERAARWYTVAQQSFSGHFGRSWSASIQVDKSATWAHHVDDLLLYAERLRRVQVEQLDWREALDRYDSPETVVYADPPYVPETRSGGTYDHELTAVDHAELVQRLLALQGRAIVSGYDHPIYRPLVQAGWHVERVATVVWAAGRTRGTGLRGEGALRSARWHRVETLWVHPDLARDAGWGWGTTPPTEPPRRS